MRVCDSRRFLDCRLAVDFSWNLRSERVSLGQGTIAFTARIVARARRTASRRMSAALGTRRRSARRDGVQSQDAPLAGNPPEGDRGPFAGEADPTCAPCEVPAGKEEGRDAREREGAFECNICLDVATDPVVTQCGHLYCWPCIYKYVRSARDPKGACGVSRFTVKTPQTKNDGGFFGLARPPKADRPTARVASARLAYAPVAARSIVSEFR